MDRSLQTFIHSIAVLLITVSSTGVSSARLTILPVLNAQAGRQVKTSIVADGLNGDLGGFDILVALNQAKYALVAARPGSYVDSCNWEYFTYRLVDKNSLTGFDLGEYTDLLEIRARADLSLGMFAGCPGTLPPLELVKINLLLAHEATGRSIECMVLPTRFFWRDCNDNIIYSRQFDSAYGGGDAFDYLDSLPVAYSYPGFGAPSGDCNDSLDGSVVMPMDYGNSIIDVLCPPGGGLIGDVNLNGIPFEVADVVLFTSYFAYGLIVFVIDPTPQIGSTDCNGDDIALSVADLVCMIREVMTGFFDNITPGSIMPEATMLEITGTEESVLRITSTDDALVVRLQFTMIDNQSAGSESIRWSSLDYMTGVVGDTLNIVAYNLDGRPVIRSGQTDLLRYDASQLRLVNIEMADQNGIMFTINKDTAPLPESFLLNQNYPNPFNAGTVISFYLANESGWMLHIFNVAGQLVREFGGNHTGKVSVDWDGRDSEGRDVASGVYFYRLKTSDTHQQRQMLLLK